VRQGRSFESAEILVPAFALVNEAARRTLGMTFYDVQLLAGLFLTRRCVAEIQTGEGKTLVAALPAFVHALTGRGVHVITSNRYLAKRDCQLLRPVFACLGCSVGLIGDGEDTQQKQAAYACDITYGPGYEFGFDYLRDQVALDKPAVTGLGAALLRELRGVTEAPRKLQRTMAFAIVDEVDHVLLDDANSPLILAEASMGAAADAEAHLAAEQLVSSLERGRHFEKDIQTGQIQLRSEGERFVHANPHAIPLKVLRRPWVEYVEQALRAHHVYRRDAHYVIQQDQVRIVDTSTGRIFSDRTWCAGLHQAIEAKHGLPITAEKRALARITRQRLFRRYAGLCGMTGTASGSRREFWEFYRLPVTPVPLQRPSQRKMLPARCFADAARKWDAISREVAGLHRRGRPVLVGTETIEHSLALAERLAAEGLPFELLNGIQDADEAAVVAQAGQPGAITIATNMAGRGTDIKIPAEVAQQGGLHVISAQYHTSRRIDRQLLGRCARQGDPGSARFFVSAEDVLIQSHGAWLGRAMGRAANRKGEVMMPLEHAIRRVQRVAERMQHYQRRHLFGQEEERDRLAATMSAADAEGQA
jgi:preprotein translocase subunit SecA